MVETSACGPVSEGSGSLASLSSSSRTPSSRPTRSNANSTQAHCLHLVANAIVYWNTIYTQRALDELGHEPASDELAGLTPTIFEHVNPLGTYDFSSDQPAGQLRPLRAATAA